MHGVIFMELRKFVGERYGADTWRKAVDDAGLTDKIYLGIEAYPDAELVALIGGVCGATGTRLDLLLEELGAFIVPGLMKTYGSLAKPQWRTLELLEHVEGTIHRVVRLRTPNAKPPKLQCARTAPDEVTILYTSQRKLCALARGMARGVATHYREEATIVEPSCMLRGDAQCRIVVRVT